MDNQNNITQVEKAVIDLYSALYNLRHDGKYKEEYNTITTIINMLSEDRLYLLQSYRKEIEE